jgi:alpha-mannosidase
MNTRQRCEQVRCSSNHERSRQITYAVRADQERLGYRPTIYLMSEHAMHCQIPQILAGCGFRGAIMRTHFMMYGYSRVQPPAE